MDIAHSYYKQIPHHNLKICFELVYMKWIQLLKLINCIVIFNGQLTPSKDAT